jgi:hypothetical protein
MTTNLDNQYKKYSGDLDEYINFLGLANKEPERSLVEEVLSLPLEALKTKSPIEIAEYSFMLAQYSLFIQNKANENECFLNWSRQNFSYFIGDDKIKLINWTKNVEIRYNRIKYLSKKIEIMSQSLANLSRLKKVN